MSTSSITVKRIGRFGFFGAKHVVVVVGDEKYTLIAGDSILVHV